MIESYFPSLQEKVLIKLRQHFLARNVFCVRSKHLQNSECFPSLEGRLTTKGGTQKMALQEVQKCQKGKGSYIFLSLFLNSIN